MKKIAQPKIRKLVLDLSKIGVSSFLLVLISTCSPQNESQTQHSNHNSENSATDALDMTEMKLADLKPSGKALPGKLDMTNLNDLKSIPKTPAGGADAATPTGQATFPTDPQRALYRCPMHAQIVQDHPGNCPICGMKLEPVQGGAASNGQSLQDRAAVQINTTRQQLIGVKVAKIQRRQAQSSLRAVAQIVENEEARKHVHTKYTGWIEKVYANSMGLYVRKGQALVDIYSPELLAAQEEYLLALETAAQFENTGFASTRETTRSVLQAAEEKLRLYDLTSAQIERLRTTRQTRRHLTLYSPVAGVITELNALHGMRVTGGMTLYTLVNLATVWAEARVYENDLADLKIGQAVTVTLPFLPKAKYSGKISFINPYLDPKTRTATVRVVLANANGALKPAMFANLEIQTQNNQQRLMIPASAVIQTGKRQLAFVAKAQGTFEPVELKLGQRLGDDYELLQGPEAGTPVVIQAQFLIDSESQLKSVVNQMTGGSSHVH